MAKRKTKPTQTELPVEGKGVAPIKIPKLDKLAREYVDDRDSRLAALQSEVLSKAKLVEALHFHKEQLEQPDGSIVYRFEDTVVSLEPGKEKLSVSAYKEVEVESR